MHIEEEKECKFTARSNDRAESSCIEFQINCYRIITKEELYKIADYMFDTCQQSQERLIHLKEVIENLQKDKYNVK